MVNKDVPENTGDFNGSKCKYHDHSMIIMCYYYSFDDYH